MQNAPDPDPGPGDETQPENIRNAPNPSPEDKEQFHHYIPRFVLRAFATEPELNYDDPVKPKRKKTRRKKKPARATLGAQEDKKGIENESPDEGGPSKAPGGGGETPSTEPQKPEESGPGKDEKNPGKGKEKAKRLRFDPSKDPYIKVYDLESGILDFQKVGRSYGHFDMYKDMNHEKVYHIEELLSDLESRAAGILNRIKKRRDDKIYKFSLTRKERNLLRKFLFVMRYRSHKFWSKYTGTLENYVHNDREMLTKFMESGSITDLRQVWLTNLEVILKTEIDLDNEWLKTIRKEMFSLDANMYLFHMQESYMAFCEPQSLEDEFVITDNGFGIFEGPVVFDTGNLKNTGADGSAPQLRDPYYTEYHKMAPLSPRLILILRSNLLRDGPPWERILEHLQKFATGPKSDSLLKDLPVKPPETHYQSSRHEKFAYTDEDEFFFTIYKANTEHVHLINTVLLQEATVSITFVSDESLRRSLNAYLKNPSFLLDVKLGVFPEFEPYLALRYQKQRLLGLLDKPYPTEGMRPLEEFKQINKLLKSNKILQPYFKLGGAPEILRYDSHQALLLIEFRSLVAKYSGPLIPWRNKVNKAALAFMSTLHPRTIWFHVKYWKIGANKIRKGRELEELGEDDISTVMESGPEDLVAKLSGFIRFDKLSELMLETSLKSIFRLDCEEKMDAQGLSENQRERIRISQDMSMMDRFGGLASSWFLSGTPYHDPQTDPRDPFLPDIPPVTFQNAYRKDITLRYQLRGNLEKIILSTRGTPDAYKWLSQLLWDNLYPLPAFFNSGV